MQIDKQPTLRLSAIQPQRARRSLHWPNIGRLACLLALIAILAASIATYFSTPNGLSVMLARPSPTVAQCARVTLIRSASGQLVTRVDEAC